MPMKAVKIEDHCTLVSLMPKSGVNPSDPSSLAQDKFTVVEDYAIIDPDSILPHLSVIPHSPNGPEIQVRTPARNLVFLAADGGLLLRCSSHDRWCARDEARDC
jgi:hypothetical protein